MIVTDLPERRVAELRRLADEGVTSFKLFMAYPGVLLADDATIFRAMRKAGEDGTLVCMHAENGVVIDELVKAALAAGHVEPKYHALTRPTRLEAEGAYRALAIAEVARVPVYIVHLSCHDALTELRRARERGVMAHAETCPQYLLLDASAYGRTRLRRREVRDDAAAAGKAEPGRAVARPAECRSGRHLDGPLPVLPARAEGAGAAATSAASRTADRVSRTA